MKRVGLASLQRNEKTRQQFEKTGQEIRLNRLQQLQSQLELFKEYLTEFASKYSKDIQSDPVLRRKFHQMCTSIGVDPLACKLLLTRANKGFWTELLGIGDYYYEIGVQIIELCMIHRDSNGGLISFGFLLKHLASRNCNEYFNDDSRSDIENTINSLSVLGHGFKVLELNSMKYLQCVPKELNSDSTLILQSLEFKTGFTVDLIADKFKWTFERAFQATQIMQQEGICWFDAVDSTFWIIVE